MTVEAQRIAIAEACGWLLDHINRSAMYYAPSMDCHVGDPLSDLNACHEFEEKLIALGPPALDTYEIFLSAICARAGNRIFRATAPQRCEAFLKALDKWTNDR